MLRHEHKHKHKHSSVHKHESWSPCVCGSQGGASGPGPTHNGASWQGGTSVSRSCQIRKATAACMAEDATALVMLHCTVVSVADPLLRLLHQDSQVRLGDGHLDQQHGSLKRNAVTCLNMLGLLLQLLKIIVSELSLSFSGAGQALLLCCTAVCMPSYRGDCRTCRMPACIALLKLVAVMTLTAVKSSVLMHGVEMYKFIYILYTYTVYVFP